METRHIDRKIILTGRRLSLRPYLLEDEADIYSAVRESLEDMYPWMPWAHREYSRKDSRAWLEQQLNEWKNGTSYEFAIIDAGKGVYLGGCGINHIDPANRRANLGYWVRSSRTGKGIAGAAATLLAGWGFSELGLNRIEIVVAVGNQRSQRVAEKTGAQREGIMRKRLVLYGQSHDAVSYSLISGNSTGAGEYQ